MEVAHTLARPDGTKSRGEEQGGLPIDFGGRREFYRVQSELRSMQTGTAFEATKDHP